MPKSNHRNNSRRAGNGRKFRAARPVPPGYTRKESQPMRIENTPLDGVFKIASAQLVEKIERELTDQRVAGGVRPFRAFVDISLADTVGASFMFQVDADPLDEFVPTPQAVYDEGGALIVFDSNEETVAEVVKSRLVILGERVVEEMKRQDEKEQSPTAFAEGCIVFYPDGFLMMHLRLKATPASPFANYVQNIPSEG